MLNGLKLLIPTVLLCCVREATPSKCKELEKLLHPNGPPEKHIITMDEKAIDVELYWGSDPARAASALLKALLTYGLGYSGVYLRQGSHATEDLVTSVEFKKDYYAYDTFVIAVSTAWNIYNKKQISWSPMYTSCSLAGPRLRNFGSSTVPVHCLLHAQLSPAARFRTACHQHAHWSFYTNATARTKCDFFDLEVLVVGNCNASMAMTQLADRVSVSETPLLMRPVDRATFLQRLRTDNQSFLFLDYDIWEGEPNVTIVEPPPCLKDSCWQDLDSTVALRIADVKLLEQYAPHVMKYAFDFNPDIKSLKYILKQEAAGVEVEEAACEWITSNKEKVPNINEYNTDNYWFIVYLCQEDPDVKVYSDIIEHFDKKHSFNKDANYTLKIKRMTFNCSNPEDLYRKILKWSFYRDSTNMVGIVAQAGAGASALRAVRGAADINTPLLLVGLAPATAGAWRITGTSRHLALALQRFVHDCNWSRIAVLSENELLAHDFYTTLQQEAQFIHRNIKIPVNFTKMEATSLFSELKRLTARIIFINARIEIADVILSVALKNRMCYEDGYVWILRDWQTHRSTLNMTLFTVSFWRRSNDSTLRDTESRIHSYGKNLQDEWPPLTVSLIDAMSMMARGFYDLYTKNPAMRQDLHTNLISHKLQEEIVKIPAAGLNQIQHLKEGSFEEIVVFVDKWQNSKYERLGTWHVNVTNKTVRGSFTSPDDLPKYDGAVPCNVQTGDSFEPICHDNALMFAIALLIIVVNGSILFVLWLRWRISNLIMEQQSRVRMKQIAERQHVANVLFAYLVRRESLELLEEIGAGRFGCVYLALLRSPATGLQSHSVAAKGLREDAAPAEESEFLHEACIIASLDHKNIIRLIGVSVDNGPPLLIMELAVFGDLSEYLRARRHFVEQIVPNETFADGSLCDEAVHVSSEALTRLGREAAAALAYLTTRGIVHCDVRAANCLIDSRRSLKLADFGMARETRISTDGTAEYVCRRRGQFPILWMAPESLLNGVFSSASDVWALGVLLVELVTLGARPYDSMSVLRVRQYVEAGGYPPLPLDASPHTRSVARQCWRRAAENRVTSREVAAFLAAHPRALSPALLAAVDVPEPRLSLDSTIESALGESPTIPLHELDSIPVDTNSDISNNCNNMPEHVNS